MNKQPGIEIRAQRTDQAGEANLLVIRKESCHKVIISSKNKKKVPYPETIRVKGPGDGEETGESLRDQAVVKKRNTVCS